MVAILEDIPACPVCAFGIVDWYGDDDADTTGESTAAAAKEVDDFANERFGMTTDDRHGRIRHTPLDELAPDASTLDKSHWAMSLPCSIVKMGILHITNHPAVIILAQSQSLRCTVCLPSMVLSPAYHTVRSTH